MKSNLLLSTILDELPKHILAIVTNAEALAIHQDTWGRQARRVASTPPPNVLLGPDPTDATLALTRCNASNPAQRWTLDNATGRLWTATMSNLPGNTTGIQKWCVGGNSIPWGRPAGLVPCDDPAYAYNASADCGPPIVCKQVMSWTAGTAQCIGV